MRNKPNQTKQQQQKEEHLPLTPLFFPGSTSFPVFSTFSLSSAGGWGVGAVISSCLCCSLLKGRTLHTPLLLHCGVFHGLQVDLCSSSMDLQGLEGPIPPHCRLHHGL